MKWLRWVAAGDPVLAILPMMLLLLMAETSASRNLNLPQDTAQSTVIGENHRALKEFFAAYTDVGHLESGSVTEKIVSEMLPASLGPGCVEMLSHWWGGGKPTHMLRVLHVTTPTDDGKQYAVLVYRCLPQPPIDWGFGYDERLAILAIGDSMSALHIVPHEIDPDKGSCLSKIEIREAFEIDRHPGVSLAISMSSENPCCDGTDSFEEEVVNYYLFVEYSVEQVLSVSKHRRDFYGYLDGDTFVVYDNIYDAQVDSRLSEDGDLTAVLSAFVTTSNGVMQISGTVEHVWNPERRKFVEKED